MQTKDRPTADFEGNALDLAMTLISARLNELPVEDREDFQQLWECLFTTQDQDEFHSAKRAMTEILTRKRAGIRSLDLSSSKPDRLVNYREYIGSKIREFRKAAGITQEDLAQRAGIFQGYISRLESNDHSPSHKTLKKIAEALKVPVTELDPTCDGE